HYNQYATSISPSHPIQLSMNKIVKHIKNEPYNLIPTKQPVKNFPARRSVNVLLQKSLMPVNRFLSKLSKKISPITKIIGYQDLTP
ncbi:MULTISPECIES: hypothetical protein, partial [unclassified Commensalibacter]|uniref:hypothetical protein n=1 Tax=unclassified Commensalibacter TaxID=2630218 RepID=UPI001E4B6BC7